MPISHQHRRFVGIAAVLAVLGLLAVVALRPDPNDALPTSAEGLRELNSLPLPDAPTIGAEYGNLSTNAEQRALVARVGKHLVDSSDAARANVSFRFYLLADANRINVFALPDGSVFITTLLLNHLKTEGQLAAMLAHEIGQLTAGNRPYYPASGVITYTREQEQKADANGVRIMSQAGYDPTALTNTLENLAEIHKTTPVEFYQSHPSPNNRLARIDYAIKRQFPDGVPESLSD